MMTLKNKGVKSHQNPQESRVKHERFHNYQTLKLKTNQYNVI